MISDENELSRHVGGCGTRITSDVSPPEVDYDVQLREENHATISLPDAAFAGTLRLLHDVLRSGRHSRLPSISDQSGPKGESAGGRDSADAGLSLQQVPGRLPDRFRLKRMLGEGGFGRVYLASDELLHRDVAIKVPHHLNAESTESRVRFFRESRAAARLNHPSIVRVLDSGEKDGLLWQITEYVSGPRLSEFLKQSGGTLPARSAAWIVCRLADAVQHAHEHGVLHRDIKPDNILLENLSTQLEIQTSPTRNSTEQLERQIPRLTDFGLARLMDDESTVSRSGVLIGTPKYMAPEQLQGKISEQGSPTDVYSLGVVLHELLTGHVPFPEATSLHSRISATEKSMRSLRSTWQGISRDLETICLKCLSLRPGDRYTSAGDLRDDLERYLDGRPTHARPLPMHEQLQRWAQRNQTLATAFCLVTILFLVVLGQEMLNVRSSRQQNQALASALDQLRSEKVRSDELLELATQHQSDALHNESKFRTLAWNSTIREALTALGRKQFRSVWNLMETLRKSQPENIGRPEWQLTSQELQHHFQIALDAGYPLHEIAAVPGTSLLAVAGASNRVTLIDKSTHERVNSIDTDVPIIHALAISADGKRLAVGGGMNSNDVAVPMVYSLETGRHLQSLSSQVTTIESLMFSSDGKHLVCGCRYEPLSIFNLEDGTIRHLPTTRRNQWLARSSDRTHFAVQHERDSIILSDFEDSTKSRTLTTIDSVAFCAWIPDTSIMACTNLQSAYIELLNVNTGLPVGRLLHTGKSFSSLAVGGPYRQIAAGRIDGSVALWQIPHGWLTVPAENKTRSTSASIPESAMANEFQLHSQAVTNLSIADDVIYSCSASGQLVACHLAATPDMVTTRVPHQTPWRGSFVSPAGNIFVGMSDGAILKMDASDGQNSHRCAQSFADVMEKGLTTEVLRDTFAVDEIAVSPNEQRVVWSNWQRQVQHRDMKTGERSLLSDSSQNVNGAVDVVSFSNNGQTFAWTGSQNELVVGKVSNLTSLQKIPLAGYGDALTFSPDSTLLACGGSHEQLMIFDVRDCTVQQTLGNCAGCTSVEWQPTGLTLLLGFSDGSIQVRSLNELNSERVALHRKEVRDIILAPDGSLAVSVDDTGQVALWDSKTGAPFGILFEPRLTARGIVGFAPAIHFLPSGDLILVYDDGIDGPQIHKWILENAVAPIE
jgi:serine/threonine protein kinase